MSIYMRQGDVPRKRHPRLSREAARSFKNEGMCYEHVVTTAGFDRAFSIMYHLRPPTRVKTVEMAGRMDLQAAGDQALRHRHLMRQNLPRVGELIFGRVPLLFNEDMACYRCRPAEGQEALYRKGSADEVIFVYGGGGALESPFGRLRYRPDDYIVIPRGTTYRLVPDDVQKEDHLILESHSAVRLPAR